MFPVQNTRLDKIALTDVPSLLSSILKTPQDHDKVRCVKTQGKFIGNAAKRKTREKKSLFENPIRKSNSKIQLEIQLEIPTR